MRSFASCGRFLVCRDFATRAVQAEKQAFPTFGHHSQTAAEESKSKKSVAAEGSKSSGLVQIAWHLAHSPPHEKLEKAWELFEEKALESCALLRGEEIVQVLYACTVARRRPKRLMSRLAEDIPDKLAQFDIDGVCICLHAYAQMRERDQRLFTAAIRKFYINAEPSVTPSHLASLLYSHARAVLSDKHLNEMVQTRLVEEAHILSVKDLASTLQAFLTFRLQDSSALIACSRVAVTHARNGEDLEPLCISLYVLTRMNVQCDDLAHAVAKQCELQKSNELGKLPASCLVQLLYSLGDSSWADMARKAAASSLGKSLHELDGPKSLVQALEAFARALHSGPPLREVCTRVAGKIVDFSVKDLIATSLACKRLGHACDEAVLEALARQAVRKGWRFNAKHAQIILECCALIRFDHPAIDELRTSIEAREAASQITREESSTNYSEVDHQLQKGTADLNRNEEDAFFQERRLEKHDIDGVASAAKAWARGKKDRSRQKIDNSKDEETGDLKNPTFSGDRGNSMSWRHAKAEVDMRDEQTAVRGYDREALTRPLQKYDEDPELREALRGYDRKVLRPSGLQSEGLSTVKSPVRQRGRSRPVKLS